MRSTAGQARTGRRGARALAAGVIGGTLAVAGALGGCAGTPGAAAVVDGRVVRASDVQVASDELASLSQGADTSAVLSVLIQEPTVTAIASEHGVGVSDADAVALLDQVATSAGLADQTFSEPTIAVARYSIASGNLQEADDADATGQEVADRLAALDVEVNPRFGTVDENNGVTGPATWSWIGSTAQAES